MEERVSNQTPVCLYKSTFYSQLSPQGSLSSSKMLQGYASSGKV